MPNSDDEVRRFPAPYQPSVEVFATYVRDALDILTRRADTDPRMTTPGAMVLRESAGFDVLLALSIEHHVQEFLTDPSIRKTLVDLHLQRAEAEAGRAVLKAQSPDSD